MACVFFEFVFSQKIIMVCSELGFLKKNKTRRSCATDVTAEAKPFAALWCTCFCVFWGQRGWKFAFKSFCKPWWLETWWEKTTNQLNREQWWTHVDAIYSELFRSTWISSQGLVDFGVHSWIHWKWSKKVQIQVAPKSRNMMGLISLSAQPRVEKQTWREHAKTWNMAGVEPRT